MNKNEKNSKFKIKLLFFLRIWRWCKCRTAIECHRFNRISISSIDSDRECSIVTRRRSVEARAVGRRVEWRRAPRAIRVGVRQRETLSARFVCLTRRVWWRSGWCWCRRWCWQWCWVGTMGRCFFFSIFQKKQINEKFTIVKIKRTNVGVGATVESYTKIKHIQTHLRMNEFNSKIFSKYWENQKQKKKKHFFFFFKKNSSLYFFANKSKLLQLLSLLISLYCKYFLDWQPIHIRNRLDPNRSAQCRCILAPRWHLSTNHCIRRKNKIQTKSKVNKNK